MQIAANHGVAVYGITRSASVWNPTQAGWNHSAGMYGIKTEGLVYVRYPAFACGEIGGERLASYL